MYTTNYALCLLLSLCLSGILCEDIEPSSCGNITDSASCCNSTLGCAFYDTCYNTTSKGLSLCLNSTLTASELNETCGEGDHNDTCESKLPSEDPCGNFNATTCCTSGIEDCKYMSCVSNSTIQGCINSSNTASLQCKDAIVKDHCATDIKDACAKFNDNQTQCCDELESGCSYVSCKGDDGKVISESCMNKTRIVCDSGTADDTACTSTPTTQAPVTTTAKPATLAPTKPTTAAPAHAMGQHFDGASFIGGMILAFGIIALIFFGCKCYKARQERNYHTL